MVLWLAVAHGGTSALWGERGELWDPLGRLPDFSYAGYREGEDPPVIAPVTSVTDHGAVADDGADDSAAFQAALDAASAAGGGAVSVPAGTWDLSDVLTLSASGVVLQGAGPDQTILAYGVSLSDVRGASEQWSWSGGLIEVTAPSGATDVASVNAPQERGDQLLALDGPAEGWVVLQQTDDGDGSLGRHLHNDQADAGDCSYMVPLVVDWVVWLEPDGQLAQPLRFDVRPEWSPVVRQHPGLTGVGIEHLALHFPDTEYPGHLHEEGYNGVSFSGGVVDSWVRDVVIHNADNGVLTDSLSKRLSVTDLTLTGRMGHHGLNVAHTADSLFTRLDLVADFVHGLSVDHRSSGNVFSRVTATDDGWGVELDHHRDSPFENLFTAFEAPTNFMFGGNTCAGPQSGARGTFWGLPGPLYEPVWGHVQTNLIGDLAEEELLTDDQEWYEPVEDLRPRDLHQAQRALRLGLPWQDTGLDEDTGDGGEGPEERCGCGSGGQAWVGLPLLLWGRRRRERALA